MFIQSTLEWTSSRVSVFRCSFFAVDPNKEEKPVPRCPPRGLNTRHHSALLCSHLHLPCVHTYMFSYTYIGLVVLRYLYKWHLVYDLSSILSTFLFHYLIDKNTTILCILFLDCVLYCHCTVTLMWQHRSKMFVWYYKDIGLKYFPCYTATDALMMSFGITPLLLIMNVNNNISRLNWWKSWQQYTK